MDKFDLQIAMQKPTNNSARLNERQFMKKLTLERRSLQARRLLMGVMGLAALLVLAGALRRNIFEVFTLTYRYLSDLPSLLSEYSSTYIATISWPSIIALGLLLLLAAGLLRARKDTGLAHSQRAFRYAAAVSVLALALGVFGLFGSPSHATAKQETLKRELNERGHLELRVGANEYELYGQSQASDDSIRNQALIEEIRRFDITKAYPDLKNMRADGFIVEIRAVNTHDDCIFYTERRLEPALNTVMDANSGCVRSDMQVRYLTQDLKPTNTPEWKVGQAFYFSAAQTQDGKYRAIAVLLNGKADDYVARNNAEKIVPKGQPSTGTKACGIDFVDSCPEAGYIDVFTNAEGRMASGEIGSSVPGDSLKPQPGSRIADLFGKITAMDNKRLQLTLINGQKLSIAWPRNIIAEFNANGATNYPTASGPLQIQIGDSLFVHMYYKDGMNLENVSISDVRFIGLAIKTTMPDPLKNEGYSKDKASQIEKY